MNPSNNNPPAWALEAAKEASIAMHNWTLDTSTPPLSTLYETLAAIIAKHAPQPDAPTSGPEAGQSEQSGNTPSVPPEHNCKPLSAQRASGNLPTPQPGPTPETDAEWERYVRNGEHDAGQHFARRLERERDEARKSFDATSLDLQNALIDRATYLRERNEARRERDEIRTIDHPEANGRKAQYGESAFELQVTREDGKIVTIHLGQEGFNRVTDSLVDMLSGAKSHDDGSTTVSSYAKMVNQRDGAMARAQMLESELDKVSKQTDALRQDRDGLAALCEELKQEIEVAHRYFAAMPDASLHDKEGGIWRLWADGCNHLKSALQRAQQREKETQP